jgi:hypothetical protein
MLVMAFHIVVSQALVELSKVKLRINILFFLTK